jgi:hypothetical protein
VLYLPGLQNVDANFLFSPEPPGTVAAVVAANPADFEAMATEQNRCTESQCLLGSSSL